jgi:hypothetical protein
MPGSTGATVTNCRLRTNGTIDEPDGRKLTVAPAATLAANPSSIPIAHSVLGNQTVCNPVSAPTRWHQQPFDQLDQMAFLKADTRLVTSAVTDTTSERRIDAG